MESSKKSIIKNPTASELMDFPELIIGLVAPIGADIPQISNKITTALEGLKYESTELHLTKEMERFGEEKWNLEKEGGLYKTYSSKMDYANKIREKYKTPDALSKIAIQTIREFRKSYTSDIKKPCQSKAYIIRQLKLPEEVTLLRKVYGKQFILVSAYGTNEERCERLSNEIRKSVSTDMSDTDVMHMAKQLIDRDANETNDFGQNLTETFHLADVFIDGINIEKMDETIKRFFNAFFGRNDISPTKVEYGMYLAKTASLKSADLSRQVGAAIISEDGDIVTQGCNEVSKAGGGIYWDGEKPDNRDVKKGFDPNDELKKDVLKNILERLSKAKLLPKELVDLESTENMLKALTDKKNKIGVLADSKLMDLTEFGRVVHAEMNTICNAARLGLSVKGKILFCTTFPCHNCTKHIIASGVKKVVYMEPYPKSKAKVLFADEIEIESNNDPNRVSFVPFLGISPLRYRDIFQKGKRKSNGKANKWYHGKPRPLVDVDFPSYTTTTEPWALRIFSHIYIE
jgi:cytidine deaminase